MAPTKKRSASDTGEGQESNTLVPSGPNTDEELVFDLTRDRNADNDGRVSTASAIKRRRTAEISVTALEQLAKLLSSEVQSKEEERLFRLRSLELEERKLQALSKLEEQKLQALSKHRAMEMEDRKADRKERMAVLELRAKANSALLETVFDKSNTDKGQRPSRGDDLQSPIAAVETQGRKIAASLDDLRMSVASLEGSLKTSLDKIMAALQRTTKSRPHG